MNKKETQLMIYHTATVKDAGVIRWNQHIAITIHIFTTYTCEQLGLYIIYACDFFPDEW